MTGFKNRSGLYHYQFSATDILENNSGKVYPNTHQRLK